MSNCITTYTGKHFDPTQPEKERICIDDIAHALSLLCRGNGHVKTFFSVGQHCILCAKEAMARGLPRRLALAALLHDASECYMSDVPRPFKKSLPEYQRQEEKLLCIIYEKYLGTGLSAKEEQQLKNIDNDLLWYDLKFLLNEEPPQPKPSVCVPKIIQSVFSRKWKTNIGCYLSNCGRIFTIQIYLIMIERRSMYGTIDFSC